MPTPYDPSWGRDTALMHLAEESRPEGAVVPPIFQNSLFTFPSVDAYWSASQTSPEGPPYHYSRIGNPTLDTTERKLAHLEGAERAKLIGGGMGAISTAILGSVAQGAHVVLVDTCYPPTRVFVQEYLARFGVTCTLVDGLTPESIIDAIRPETTLVYLESPSSFIFRLQDIPAVTRVTREKGITTIIDNTCATSLYQNPIAMGVDVVVHSASKYFGGHSDLNGGVIACSQERMHRLVMDEVNLLGNIMAPFPAWLVMRGIRTLSLRVKQHGQNANAVAEWLEGHAGVERVFHVGLPSFPQHDLYLRQMRGTGGLLSFEPVFQTEAQVKQFVDALRIFQIGVSWGGFESLVVPLYLQPSGWSEGRWLVRIFCGLEDVGDLIADLQQAFDRVEP